MDILISSNLERLLYSVAGSENVTAWMKQLSSDGKYEVDAATLEAIKSLFAAGCCDDNETKATISKVFKEKNYLCDTHTAVAVEVYEKYKEATGDKTKTIIASTASPYKFPRAVLKAISGENEPDDFEAAKKIEDISGLKMPKQLSELSEKAPRFTSVCEREDMTGFVLSTVGGDC
jgi:threonine synthase